MDGYDINKLSISLPQTLYLAHTQAGKTELKAMGCGQGKESRVLTIHEAQGLASKNVVIVRTASKKAEIYNSIQHAVVAITRHTENCIYLTEIESNAAHAEILAIRVPESFKFKEKKNAAHAEILALSVTESLQFKEQKVPICETTSPSDRLPGGLPRLAAGMRHPVAFGASIISVGTHLRMHRGAACGGHIDGRNCGDVIGLHNQVSPKSRNPRSPSCIHLRAAMATHTVAEDGREVAEVPEQLKSNRKIYSIFGGFDPATSRSYEDDLSRAATDALRQWSEISTA
ncbi:hypothetical protein EVAR_59587_1 [Eumeta japonica]|uniref:(+)RNA virus helicase C-terminal domain-containing protein n=1 Tax=Eumeta variegata TaxID=151549 RepID=A0A4C1Z7T6_EUMVA|nr:hypothetical protein EVAR_59587_1 [Eumeta japonica]